MPTFQISVIAMLEIPTKSMLKIPTITVGKAEGVSRSDWPLIPVGLGRCALHAQFRRGINKNVSVYTVYIPLCTHTHTNFSHKLNI